MRPFTFPPPVLTGSGSTGSRARISALLPEHPEVLFQIGRFSAHSKGKWLEPVRHGRYLKDQRSPRP